MARPDVKSPTRPADYRKKPFHLTAELTDPGLRPAANQSLWLCVCFDPPDVTLVQCTDVQLDYSSQMGGGPDVLRSRGSFKAKLSDRGRSYLLQDEVRFQLLLVTNIDSKFGSAVLPVHGRAVEVGSGSVMWDPAVGDCIAPISGKSIQVSQVCLLTAWVC
jgi:hypothetical protein